MVSVHICVYVCTLTQIYKDSGLTVWGSRADNPTYPHTHTQNEYYSGICCILCKALPSLTAWLICLNSLASLGSLILSPSFLFQPISFNQSFQPQEESAHLVPISNEVNTQAPTKIEMSRGLSVRVYIKYYWSGTRHKVLLLVSTCHSKFVKRIIYFVDGTRTRLKVTAMFWA